MNAPQCNGGDCHDRPKELRGGTVVTVNGVELTVYGNVSASALQQINHAQPTNPNLLDPADEEEEERLRRESAIARANREDEARRSAPIPPDRREAIMGAMLNVSIGGFCPNWASKVNDEQWMEKLKELNPRRG